MLALWSLALLLASAASVHGFEVGQRNQREVEGTLQVPDGLDRGVWGNVELCKEGSYAYAFDLKYADLGHIDDTAVNAVRLYCEGDYGYTGSVTSLVGKWGVWKGERSCSYGDYYKGMRLQVMSYQGALGDDLGVTNVEMMCQDGYIHNGLYGTKQVRELENTRNVPRDLPHSLPRGLPSRVKEAVRMNIAPRSQWSLWASCSNVLRICGIQTRVEPEHVFDDDAGLTDLVLFCCN